MSPRSLVNVVDRYLLRALRVVCQSALQQAQVDLHCDATASARESFRRSHYMGMRIPSQLFGLFADRIFR
jgi:hypothetical protein